MSQQAGRYQRSAAGMVGAMIVLVVVVVGFVLFRDANRVDPPSPVENVDYEQAADYARDQAGFDLVSPAGLPEGWRATSARYVPGGDESWHLGLLTQDERYVGLEQSGSSVDSMVEEFVDPDATRAGPAEVDGRPWQTWKDDGGDLALVRSQGGTTTLVVGHDVPEDELVGFAASLR